MSDPIPVRIEQEVQRLGHVPTPSGASVIDLVGDGIEGIRYVEDHYEPTGEGAERRAGLSDAGLPADTPDVLRYLVAETEEAQRVARAPAPAFPVERLRELLPAIERPLDWLARLDPELAAELAGIRQERGRRKRPAALVVTLGRLLTVADEQAEKLRALPTFKPVLVAEGRELVAAFTRAPNDARGAARTRRNALLTLLREQLRQIAEAADFVFHDRPDLARLARSERVRQHQAHVARARRARRPSTASTVTADATPVAPTGPSEQPA